MIYKRNIFTGLRNLIYAIAALLMVISCKNDIETIQALTSESTLPDVTGFNVEMSYTDSGTLKGKIIAPEVYQYNRREEPYNEFPKGMRAVFYDTNGKEVSYIKANYAIFYTKKELWEGRNEVFGENYASGEKIETEQLFWDQKEKRIYSDKFSKVTNVDGVFIGENGFEADEDLSPLRLNGYSGKVTVTDNPVQETDN
jgi:LPS export ABC transporter protein LptC